jgi:Spy/CpxP family protein refolding chaperone
MSLKIYTKAALLLALFFLCARSTHAQDSLKTKAETRAQKLTDKMKTALSLSDDQYAKVYDINLKYAKKNETLMEGSGSKLSKFQALKSDNEEKTKELKAVLTKEQFDKYKEMQQEMKEGVREALKERKGG